MLCPRFPVSGSPETQRPFWNGRPIGWRLAVHVPSHNLEPLIDAARELSDTNVLFQFVGEGAKKPKLEELVASYGLANVQFLPYQPMRRLAETLSAADVAVVCLESGHTGISVPSKAYGVIASGTPIR